MEQLALTSEVEKRGVSHGLTAVIEPVQDIRRRCSFASKKARGD
jgi:hypothetical protein